MEAAPQPSSSLEGLRECLSEFALPTHRTRTDEAADRLRGHAHLRCRRYHRLSQEDADDIAQQVIQRLMSAREKGSLRVSEDDRQAAAFLNKITDGLCNDRHRRAERRHRVGNSHELIDECAAPSAADDDDTGRKRLLRDVYSEIRRVKGSTYLSVFLAHARRSISTSAAALRLRISKQALLKGFQRLLDYLRRRFGGRN